MFELIEFILLLIVNSLFITGLHYAFQYESDKDGNLFDKKILWFIRFYARKYLGEFWSMPFGGCLICMAGLWSLPVFMPYYFDATPNVYLACKYILYVPMLAGMNRLVTRIL